MTIRAGDTEYFEYIARIRMICSIRRWRCLTGYSHYRRSDIAVQILWWDMCTYSAHVDWMVRWTCLWRMIVMKKIRPMLGGEESPSAIMLTHSCGHAWIFLYSRWLMMARTKFNIHVIRQINCEHRFHTRTHGFNMFTCVFILRWQNEAGAGSM